MEIFLDETGAFRPSTSAREEPDLAAVLAVIVPEADADGLGTDFSAFLAKLPRECFDNGEPKGRLLSAGQYQAFAEMLNGRRGIMLVPTTFNRSIDSQFFSSFPRGLRAVLEAEAQKCIHATMKSEVEELARRSANLSAEQLARLLTYKVAVEKAINAVSLFYHCPKYHGTYARIKVVFDRTGSPNNREELVFKDMVFTWITRNTIPTIKEIHTEDHPFRRLYGAEIAGKKAFDLAKMLRGNFEFRDSKSCWQLQVADIAAAAWINSVRDRNNERGFLQVFRSLHRNTSLPRQHPLELMSIAAEPGQTFAPVSFNIFHDLVKNEGKVLPCSWD